ncbi:hypothetical protein ACIGNX_01180 [Actinosynnema sp. NPDC053489]|uniref:hypothetical protein n=1 Tax=Actinosynnema sp. NPDC053489 TaxID=3363916 RepID=UPI0037C704C4
MTTNKGKGRRIGLFDYLGNLLDDTKDYVDDVLARGRDVEDDVRSTTRRALRRDDEPDTTADIEDLRARLEELSAAVRNLGTSGSGHGQPVKTR